MNNLPISEQTYETMRKSISNDLPKIINDIKMENKDFVEFHLARGIVGGFELLDGVLEVAFIKLIIRFNFDVVAYNLRKFIACFKDN